MPIYEFYSPDTNRIYSFFARSLAQGAKVPKCPDQQGARMERMVSRFAVTGRAKENPSDTGEASDPRMERMMAEMEREMSSLDEANPDPRALGRMMRKMSEATGQPVPPEMEQMICSLESGEDPEKLEEEFGGAFDSMALPEEAGPGGVEGAIKNRIRRPRRDPKLYEMSDFI